jgi:hypothetical protein
MIKSKRLRWEGHVARMEQKGRSSSQFYQVNPQEKSKHRWKVILKKQ